MKTNSVGRGNLKKSASRILEIGGETFAESRFETLSLSWVIALFIGLGGDNNSHLACWVAPLYCTLFKILFTFSHSCDAQHLFCTFSKYSSLFSHSCDAQQNYHQHAVTAFL